jgi:hypothetical protein
MQSIKDQDKKRLHATVPAKTIGALADFIREVQDASHSDEVFYSQLSGEMFGLYLIPQAEGVLCVVTDSIRMAVVREPKGRASAALKVYLPWGMLEASKAKWISIVDENGTSFEVEAEPKPGVVIFDEHFGIVSVEHKESWQEHRFPGCFGSWHNNDHDNVRDMGSYRCEEKDVSWLLGGLDGWRTRKSEPVSDLKIDLRMFGALAKCAEAYGSAYEMRFNGDREVVIESADGHFFAVLMPLSRKEKV